jgi:tetratricopeptide (TPR) repeat protein
MAASNAWFCKQMAVWAAFFGRSETSEHWWHRRLVACPDDTHALASIAHLRAQAGDTAGSIAAFEAAVATGEAPASVWFNLGFMRQEAGDHPRAIDAFDRAIALDEKLDRAWYGKALSLIKLDRVADAIPLLKKNTELQPMSPFGWYQLAHAYHRLGQTDRVEKTIRQLAGFEPKVAQQLERETGVHVGVDVPF